MAMEGILSLRWNNHSSSFLKYLSFLRDKDTFSDLTLVCGGQYYRVHRLVVSCCSELLRATLEDTPHPHLAVALRDLAPRHLEALLSYMYIGQVTVPEGDLFGLLEAAEYLGVKGIAIRDEAPTPPHGHPVSCQEEGSPHPKRRRKDKGGRSPVSSPASPPLGDVPVPEDHRDARESGGRSSPPPPTSTNAEWDGDSFLGFADMCEDLAGQQEAGQAEGDNTSSVPTLPECGNSSVPPQQPTQPQSYQELVTQALLGSLEMHGVSSQGWEGGRGKTGPAPAFSPRQETRAPTHHTPLHHRSPGKSKGIRRGHHQQPPYSALQGDIRTPWVALTRLTDPQASEEAASLIDRRFCEFCGFKSRSPSQLKKHLRVHTGLIQLGSEEGG
ncbi:Longitudinals lacking protein-like [Chionoecetes opilio]|uniref:Longitudinals lacking protein-like n=1 Tax=Chionoecetes opilio TaxID=41210 RepID=A0A8J4YKZ6_CHIOP|nr:Longitudinals lacking protein-like [Chionoecetes opilio]